MKRIFGLLLDLLFFISLLGVVIILGLYIIYNKNNDISIINDYLQSELVRSLLIIYAVYIASFLAYFWLIPVLLKQTLGQRLVGMGYESEHKIGLWNVFLKTIVGPFWDFVFFPYTLFVLIKKKPIISVRISGISTVKSEKKTDKLLLLVSLIFTIYVIGTLAAGTFVYKTGITNLLERYTNYEKQVSNLIDKMAYQDASPALEKYKQYHGEDNNYSYYNCIIVANLSSELTNIDICEKAFNANSLNTDRLKEIVHQEAKTYAANDSYKEAEVLYTKLWNDYHDRSIDMKNYVVVLSELGKGKEATTILNEIASLIPNDDEVAQRDLGNLYERIGDMDKASEKYELSLSLIKDGENQSLAGELYYDIGVLYYKKSKYTEATTAFNKAKELNKDYAEPVDSYIILISKLKNSVTK